MLRCQSNANMPTLDAMGCVMRLDTYLSLYVRMVTAWALHGQHACAVLKIIAIPCTGTGIAIAASMGLLLEYFARSWG